MTKNFKFLPDVATADIAFEAKGKNLDEVFQACADATFAEMADVKTVGKSYTTTISLKNDDMKDLLYEFLEEIVFIKDRDYVVFGKCDATIKESKGKYILKAKLYGDKINIKKHRLGQDVKAVTMHMFNLEKKGEKYVATVVLDI